MRDERNARDNQNLHNSSQPQFVGAHCSVSRLLCVKIPYATVLQRAHRNRAFFLAFLSSLYRLILLPFSCRNSDPEPPSSRPLPQPFPLCGSSLLVESHAKGPALHSLVDSPHLELALVVLAA